MARSPPGYSQHREGEASRIVCCSPHSWLYMVGVPCVCCTVSQALPTSVHALRQLRLPQTAYQFQMTSHFVVLGTSCTQPESHIHLNAGFSTLHAGVSVQRRGGRKCLPRRRKPGSSWAVPLDLLGAEKAHGSGYKYRFWPCLRQAFCA